jgi:hypothetical protein
MIKKLFKTGVTAAAGWVGNAIGGSTGRTIATKAVGSLFSKDGGQGGNFQLQDTSVEMPNFGGRLGFDRSDKAGSTSNIKTANGEELRNEWDYRLTKWFKNKDSMFT